MSFLCCRRKCWVHLDSVDITNFLFFSSVLTLAGAKRQFAKHFSLIFKFPWRFKKNLIHMFLIHLHSTHKEMFYKLISLWSRVINKLSNEPSSFHWNPDAVFHQLWANLKTPSLDHKWEDTDGFGTQGEKRNPHIIESLLKYEALSFLRVSFNRWMPLSSLKRGRFLEISKI